MEVKDISQVAKALGDPIRLEIIKQIKERERCVCHLMDHFDLKQPNLSYHIKILSEAGLIKGRQEGKWNHYSLNEERLRDFLERLGGI